MSRADESNEPSPERPESLAVSLVLVFAAVMVGFLVGLRTSPAGTPPQHSIAFNHRVHIELGSDCVDCHASARSEPSASLPDLAACEECHGSEPSENSEESRLAAMIAARAPLAWNPVTMIENGTVFFSHRRHAGVAKIACATCHGAMAERTRPPATPAVKLSMDFCVDCHAHTSADQDCLACHR